MQNNLTKIQRKEFNVRKEMKPVKSIKLVTERGTL